MGEPTVSINVLDAIEDAGKVTLPPVGGASAGRTLKVRPATRGFLRRYAALEAMPIGPAADEELEALVRWAVPGITEAELDEMTPGMMMVPLLQAQGQLTVVLRALERQRARRAGKPEGNGAAPAGKKTRQPRRRSK